MRSQVLLFPTVILTLASGCDTVTRTREHPDEGSLLDIDTSDDGTLTVASTALPTSLTCVSAPTGEGGMPEVLRIAIATEGATGTVTMQRGPQFWSHSGMGSGAIGEPDVRTVSVDDGHLAEDSHGGPFGGLDLSLKRDGAFVTGTLVDEQCYSRLTTELTCWNELELFGSPWAGVVGSLPAHFDWETGACLDDDGNAAVNDIPVEFVRETGYGECADLRGTALNGGDLWYPDLSGWYLVGAQLDAATLYFANLSNATLHGAQLAEIAFGYATIEGSVDGFTELPESCETTESSWSGAQTVCHQ